MIPQIIFPPVGNPLPLPHLAEVGATLRSDEGIQARITKDGTLVIPRTDKCSSINQAVDVANDIFGTLLLGNFHAETVNQTAIVAGFFDGETRSTLICNVCAHGMMRAGRHGWETSSLLSSPRVEKTEAVENAYLIGLNRKKLLPNFPVSTFIQGYTGLIRSNVSDAIIGLWATTESLTEELCKRHMGSRKRRRESKHKTAKLDWRTLTVGERHSELRNRNVIGSALLANLNKCRLARNNLIHSQKIPTYDVAALLWESMVDMLVITSSDESLRELKSIIAYAYSPMAKWCAPLNELVHPTFDKPPPSLPAEFVLPNWDLWRDRDQ